jgi:hypothetical protein
MIRFFIPFLGLAIILNACQQKTTETTASITIKPKDLIGKTIEYQYGENIYHVTIDSDSLMHWEAMAGAEKGAFENETYIIEAINDGSLFITWGEANGIGVAQVLDFEKGIVYNHLLRGRAVRSEQGKIRILEP